MQGNIFQVKVGDLLAHPLNRKIYGDEEADDNLVAGIRLHGIGTPIVVRTMPSLAGEAGKELWRIQKDLAKQRERIRKSKVTQENFPESSEVTRENFPQSPNLNNQKEIFAKSKKSRDIAAESLAMSGRQAEKLLAVIDAADAGNDVARTLLDSLNSRAKSIDAAHKELTGKGKVESRA